MKLSLFTLISIFTVAFSVFAQTEPKTSPKLISGGIVNGKAKTLAKPVYPPAGKAVNAGGAVNVQITIDENGDVISAAAVSGHPLLRQAAVAAALQSKFLPTVLGGVPVKVAGILVYNFIPAASSWFRAGYDLVSFERIPTLKYANLNSIGGLFASEWAAERDQLKRLETIKQSEESGYSDVRTADSAKVNEKTTDLGDGKIVKQIVTEKRIYSGNPPNAEQVAISQSLVSSLQGRLAGDQINGWKFNLGVAFSRALSAVRNPTEKQNALDNLRQQIANAPTEILPEHLETARKIITLLESPNPTSEESRNQLGQLLPLLMEI